jgi:DNA-binding transcriptional MerR regulator
MTTLMEEREWLTVGEVARLLDVDRTTVWRYGTSGLLRYRQFGSHGWRRYARADVARLATTVDDEEGQ